MSTSHTDKYPRQGQLFIISAPSGTGKTTLVRALVAKMDQIMISVSHTTRQQRPGETEGVDYHFIEDAAFDAMTAGNRFLEHARVFGHRYGTAAEVLEQQLGAGVDVILEIDWQGAQQVRTRVPGTISIFIVPPSYDSLVQRLQGRGRDEPQTIAQRMAEAVDELSHYDEFDYVIVNDRLEEALQDMRTIIEAARLRTACRRPALDDFVGRLMAQARGIQ